MMPMFIFSDFPIANVWYSFKTSNFSGQAIIIILLGMSVFAWTVMISKYLDLKRARLASDKFVLTYRRDKQPLDMFLQRRRFEESPVYLVYEKACTAVGIEMESREGRLDSSMLALGSRSPRLNQLQIEAVRNAAQREVADQVLQLESRMDILATAVSASPLLGLLGTVWGVMDAFTEMAIFGSANLSAIAPGIAGALLTTVVGLLVALPSSIAYNYIVAQIRNITVQMDNFSDALVADMQRTFTQD